MADELKTIKFQMMLSPTEAKLIDDWSFENRIRSRAEAIRRLCQVAMAQEDHLDLVKALAIKMLSEHLASCKQRISELRDTRDEGKFVKETIDYERTLAPGFMEIIHMINDLAEASEKISGREAGADSAKDALAHKIQVMNTVIAEVEGWDEK